MNIQDKILLETHAKICTIFSPARRFTLEIGRNLYFHRKRFFEAGLPWRAGGLAADRKAAERAREALEKLGLVSTVKTRERMTFLRLTPKGESTACGLVGLPSLRDSIEVMKSLVGHAGERQGGWVSEADLLGINLSTPPSLEDWRESTYGLLQKFWPSLIRSWVEVNSTPGLAFYRLLPIGRKILVKPPSSPTKHPEPSLEAVETFWDCYFAEQEKLYLSDESIPDSELGLLPLSCSLPLKS